MKMKNCLGDCTTYGIEHREGNDERECNPFEDSPNPCVNEELNLLRPETSSTDILFSFGE